MTSDCCMSLKEEITFLFSNALLYSPSLLTFYFFEERLVCAAYYVERTLFCDGL